jgi:hypothetical protein
MQSRVFSNSPQGKPNGPKIWGKEWEDQILGLVNYSLSQVKIHAGSKMKGGGGRLWVFYSLKNLIIKTN